MTRVLITDITCMNAGSCVVGLVREQESYRSVRPLPPIGPAWLDFHHARGDLLRFDLSIPAFDLPHLEDRRTTGVLEQTGPMLESEVVERLRKAELAENLDGLFGCSIQNNANGRAFVRPANAIRSICGCSTLNLRLSMIGERLRAALVMTSEEALPDLPVVDRDWKEFVQKATDHRRGANRYQRLQHFLAVQFQQKMLACPHHFVRVGITRPLYGRCWLMLDTLFPLPKPEWLAEF